MSVDDCRRDEWEGALAELSQFNIKYLFHTAQGLKCPCEIGK